MDGQGILMTGGGGFLGRFVVERYLKGAERPLYLLEHAAFVPKLRAYLEAAAPDALATGRARILEGDITRPGLGIDAALRDELRARVGKVLHFAALYHLSAPRDAIAPINVDGTRNMLDFCEELPRLERFGHISTMAVAGKYEGIFDETDFDKGQAFKNYYEETKFLSEKLVRERMPALPAVIFRPAVVIGHSQTGYIEKLDGPYYLLVSVARGLQWVMPDCGLTKCHVAPVDFVTDGIYEIFENAPDALGAVCCLMDPAPITYNHFLDLSCEHWPRHKPVLRLPFALVKAPARLKLFETVYGIPWEAFQYGGQIIEYTFPESTRRLAGRGVRCPRLPDYIGVLVRYYREHLQDPAIRRGDWRAMLRPGA